MGSIPASWTWEPWLTDFESVRIRALHCAMGSDQHGLAAVARGDYDF
jgi:hypothetical protein